jgi:hypothetical protein
MRARKFRTTYQWKYDISILKLAFGFDDGEVASDDYYDDDDEVMS